LTRVAILGAGNMGTALAKMLSENGSIVALWSIEEDVVKEINETGRNSKYLQGIQLKKEVKAYSELKDALKTAEVVVFAVPSNVLRSVSKDASSLISSKAIIVNTAKGIEDVTNKRMSEVISEYSKNPIVSIGGPSIANELVNKVPTYAVMACANALALKTTGALFKNDYYIVSNSSDIIGLEWCGALKNIIAISAGMIDGLGYGDNTKAGVITRGLNELAVIVEASNGKKETVYGLAGIGDLLVTCNSMHSRNRRFGEKIAKGLNVEEANKEIGQVVEGLNSIRVVKKIVESKNLSCPLITKTYEVLYNHETAKSIL
jgi:glycerol-3-phosphate dehydrogenase (NAD(P)+)